jgi:hypothetical protein
MGDHAQDFRDRMERYEAEPPTAWKPEPGGLLLGPILELDWRTTAHSKRQNDCPVLTVRDEAEDVVYEFWAFHDVAKSELAKLGPQVGERIAVRFLGRHANGYFMYKIKVDRSGPSAFDWGAVQPDPKGLPPDANVLELREREKAPENPLVEDVDPEMGF